MASGWGRDARARKSHRERPNRQSSCTRSEESVFTSWKKPVLQEAKAVLPENVHQRALWGDSHPLLAPPTADAFPVGTLKHCFPLNKSFSCKQPLYFNGRKGTKSSQHNRAAQMKDVAFHPVGLAEGGALLRSSGRPSAEPVLNPTDLVTLLSS